MHRFFLPPGNIGRMGVLFPAETAHQIRKVLRLRPGALVTVLDGNGWEYTILLEKITNEKVWGSFKEKHPAGGEPALQLTLYLSLTQRDKFEWALQKCTEVGASVFVPVISNRTLARDKEQALQKMERWGRILKEAAEQSGRGRIPQICPPITLLDAFQEVSRSKLEGAFLWEKEERISLFTWLLEKKQSKVKPLANLALFVGPEGGYTEEEVEQARQAGVETVSLGKLILRMETAAVVSCALALQIFEAE